jgi:hypothetical protein
MAGETNSFVCAVLGTSGLITIFFSIVEIINYAVTPY